MNIRVPPGGMRVCPTFSPEGPGGRGGAAAAFLRRKSVFAAKKKNALPPRRPSGRKDGGRFRRDRRGRIPPLPSPPAAPVLRLPPPGLRGQGSGAGRGLLPGQNRLYIHEHHPPDKNRRGWRNAWRFEGRDGGEKGGHCAVCRAHRGIQRSRRQEKSSWPALT